MLGSSQAKQDSCHHKPGLEAPKRLEMSYFPNNLFDNLCLPEE